MAAPVCCVRTVIRGALRRPSFSCPSPGVSIRFYAAESAVVKKFIIEKKSSKEPLSRRITREQLLERRKDTERPKPYGLTAWRPSDDVYVARYYRKPTLQPEAAIEALKTFQRLDFSSPAQNVYAELRLDMKMEKKKKVDPFVGYVHLPFPFVKEPNKVVVFTEKAEEAEIAKRNGAAFVGGIELVPQILNDEIQADFYIATPDVIAKLNVLKNKLRKKFPKSKRGSVGNDVANMLRLFETCYEYVVEKECMVLTKIATLDMPVEHIAANLDALVKDVCTHKPSHFGPFVERALITSTTSEALFIDCQKFFPQVAEDNEED